MVEVLLGMALLRLAHAHGLDGDVPILVCIAGLVLEVLPRPTGSGLGLGLSLRLGVGLLSFFVGVGFGGVGLLALPELDGDAAPLQALLGVSLHVADAREEAVARGVLRRVADGRLGMLPGFVVAPPLGFRGP
uniref:Uncharacterized protein n=1 Tax=Phaeomonas parva TaxID=124430 RepID=A0A7S1UBF2_9STRA